MSDDGYQEWIEQRRALVPPEYLSDRVMQSVVEVQTLQSQVFALRLASWFERSRLARYVAYGAAMLIGSVPFATFFVFLMFWPNDLA